MKERTGSLLGRVALRFAGKHKQTTQDLSTALRTPTGSLLVAGDELASLELLAPTPSEPHVYTAQERIDLHAPLELAADAEVDIEGLACSEDGAAMFVIGSHSARRKKPRGKREKEDLERLASVKVEDSRNVLLRLPLDHGVPVIGDEPGKLVAKLPGDGERSLLGLLADDPHLGPFVRRDASVPIPGKDNGFDIEGLAYLNGRLLVGLRGPVLRGWAFVLDFELEVRGEELDIVGKKQRYRKHALDLDGLGVRELIVCGDDLLVLAGPTMALDGAHRIFRWPGGPSQKRDSVVAQGKGQLEHLFDVPSLQGYDRAEGATLTSWFRERDALLVVYDSPTKARMLDAHTVIADVFAL
jgi:hypothetical protein